VLAVSTPFEANYLPKLYHVLNHFHSGISTSSRYPCFH